MNRRNFLSAMLRAGAGFALLPAATTYARRWVAPSSGRKIWLLDWDQIEPGPVYQCVMDSPMPECTLFSHTWTATFPVVWIENFSA